MTFAFSKRTSWPLEESRWAKAAASARKRGGAIDLTESNPTRCRFQFSTPEILRSFSAPSNLLYEPDSSGFLPAREAVSAYYREKGAEVLPSQILLTAGSSEAYSFLLKLLLDPGGTVLVPSPGYPLLDPLADLSDARLARYPLSYDDSKGWAIDRSAFLGSLTAGVRAAVVVNPNHPTGHRTDATDREWLEGLAAERGFALISDEVFLDFTFEARAAGTLALNRKALTFTLSGISKILGLPQMKLSWIVATGPAGQVSEALSRLTVIADTYLSVSGPPQRALAAWMSGRKDVVAEITHRVRDNRAVLEGALAGKKARLLRADGGWCGVVRFEGDLSDEEASLDLIGHGVLVHPGYLYDFADERHLVVSLLPEKSRFAEGVSRLAGFLV